jgi:sec-independent protein translocase protein TatA
MLIANYILGSLLLLGMPSGPELIIVVLIILLFFGAKRIPELARGLGKGIREFKDATKEVKKEIDDTTEDTKKSLKD